jgi:hypothetical protein
MPPITSPREMAAMIADAVVMRLAAEGACRRRLKREWRKAYLWALRDEP